MPNNSSRLSTIVQQKEKTDLPMSGAKRQASYRMREILKRETPEELEAWLAKNREHSKMSKRRERERQKHNSMLGDQTDHMTPVEAAYVVATSMKEPSMTANAICQRRFREKGKQKKKLQEQLFEKQ